MIYKKMHWGVFASLLAAVFDEKGKAVEPDLIYEERNRPPFPTDDFQSIKPGESFTMEDLFSPLNQGIRTPGTYKLVVIYHSPVGSDDVAKGLNVLVKEMGYLYSEPVTFKVIQ